MRELSNYSIFFGQEFSIGLKFIIKSTYFTILIDSLHASLFHLKDEPLLILSTDTFQLFPHSNHNQVLSLANFGILKPSCEGSSQRYGLWYYLLWWASVDGYIYLIFFYFWNTGLQYGYIWMRCGCFLDELSSRCSFEVYLCYLSAAECIITIYYQNIQFNYLR